MIQFCFQYLNFSPLHVIALYAPAKSSQRTQWFAECFFKTTKQVDLLLGDFNFIEDKRDTNASNPHIDRHLVATFKQFLSEHSLVDILPMEPHNSLFRIPMEPNFDSTESMQEQTSYLLFRM
jgi:hypothetical protein